MVAFDTLSAATRLRKEAGFSEHQARVLVDTFRALEHRMTIELGGIVSLALGILVALEALVF